MGTKQVLIVDDAIDLGRLLMEALRAVHPELSIKVVPSAEEAILESTRFHINLLITDIRLPGITGLDLVRKIRVRQPGVKVMVISGLTLDTRLKKQLDELAPEAFMHKPMSMPDFVAQSEQLLGIEVVPFPELGSEKKVEPKPVESKPEPKPESKPPVDKAPDGKKPARRGRGTGQQDDDEMLMAVLAQALPGISPGEIVVKPAAAKTDGESKPAPVQDEGLSGRLSGLRSSLGAIAAILLDDRGHPVAQAGDLPDSGLMEQIVSPMMAALSAGARLSYLLGGANKQAVHAYRGKDIDLVLATVGQYALMVVLKPGKSSIRLALAFEEALNAQGELVTVLEEMGLHMQSTAEMGSSEKAAMPESAAAQAPQGDLLTDVFESPLANDPGLDKLEELLGKKDGGPGLDLDSFWESASESDKSTVDAPGVLSFEQAQKLGLLPGDGGK